ncbi:Zn-ribbon domain-containing OB-fold protein [Lacisediminimonas profundi]|uniref:Zn-ribbon domain-containing OB-fold protein n=1 Tax=Lacisediminimonas profundi TaxID=2603856 RepID=UPI00124B0555|nr:Zn-ribbon domain-containing OB-fold protein [Lacisediminimonas profundi]
MSRPLPRPTADTRHFWDGCATGELRYQRCAHCGEVQLIPRSLCSACQHADLEWHRSGGQGRVLSYTVVHRAPTPAFKDETPYIIALVDMSEGFRLMVNVRGGGATPLAIGQSVRIGFREIEGMALPEAQVLE